MDIEIQAKEIMFHKANLNRIMAECTGQPIEQARPGRLPRPAGFSAVVLNSAACVVLPVPVAALPVMPRPCRPCSGKPS